MSKESVGLKASYANGSTEDANVTLEAFKRDWEAGVIGKVNGFEFDVNTEGGLVKRLGSHALDIGMVTRPESRPNGQVEILWMTGLVPNVEPEPDKKTGIEVEKLMGDEDGDPKAVRGYNPETGENFALVNGASLTPEMLTDLDESDTGPFPKDRIVDELFSDLSQQSEQMNEDGAYIIPYSLTPHEVTDERIEKYPYVSKIVYAEPDRTFHKYFGVAGMQLHRQIRRRGESPSEALELSAHVANRIVAFSWLFELVSGGSPNLEGQALIDRYMEAKRLHDEEKKDIADELHGTNRLGHSLRTIGRYAGSVSGGIHDEPLPEDEHGLLAEMHNKLKARERTTAARVTKEHGDIRLRIDNKQGTYETSVPDLVLRKPRVDLLVNLFHGIVEEIEEDPRESGELVIARNMSDVSHQELNEFDLLMSKPWDGVSTSDLSRNRRNAMEVALKGPRAEIELAPHGRPANRNAGQLAMRVARRLFDKGHLTAQDMREMRVATAKRVNNWILDDDNLPSAATYFEGKAPSLSLVAEERRNALRERNSRMSEEDLRRSNLQDATKSLHNYLKQMRIKQQERRVA